VIDKGTEKTVMTEGISSVKYTGAHGSGAGLPQAANALNA